MALSRQVLEQEIEGTKAVMKSTENTIEIHKVVLAAFEKELAKLPPAPKPKPVAEKKQVMPGIA